MRRPVEVVAAQVHHLDDVVDELARPQHAHRCPHRFDLGTKTLQRAKRGLRHTRHAARLGDDRQDVRLALAGKRVDRVDGDVADLARRHRDDAREAQRVPRVEAEAHVGDQVLDLAPLPESNAADQPVGNATSGQHVFEGARLCVGAVEHREVGVTPVLRLAQALDLIGDELGLLDLVVSLGRDHLLAPGALGPQALGGALGIAADDAVGGVQDGLAGAVVLLEVHDMGVGVVLAELEDVADVGSAEAIDGLVVVAHDRDVAVLRRQQVDEDVLRAVGVLVLVDEDVAEAIPPLGEGLGVGAEELGELHQQVVEVKPA